MSSILQVERLTSQQLREATLQTMRELADQETDPIVKAGQSGMIEDFERGAGGEAWAKSEVAMRAFLLNLARSSA